MTLRRSLAIVCCMMVLGLVASRPASADIFSRILVGAEKAGSRAARSGSSLIDNAAHHLKALPSDIKGPALAAHVGAEGHWTFVNRAGERFTASGPDEMKRAVAMLAPEAVSAEARLTLVLTEDVAFRHPAMMKDLPKKASFRLAVGDETYALVRREERLFAEVRPSVLAELSERRLFDETIWQLARPMVRTRMRVLALEPGGPQTLGSLPRLDPQTKRALPDRIDPDKLTDAISALKNQTVVVTGRIEGPSLVYRVANGSEQRLVLKDLLAAAEAHDVGLVVLRSASPRQPGTRNWLWQRVDVDGLDRALERATMSDFLDSLAAGQSKLLIEASDRGQYRTVLRAIPLSDESVLPSLGGLISDLSSELAGRVLTSAIDADVPSADRQRELDLRLVPGIPATIQGIYLGLLLLGLVGVSFAASWWQRIWPPERREGYGNLIGFLCAWMLRALAFTFVFVPLVAVASGPMGFFRSAWETVAGTVAILTWPLRRLRKVRGV